MKDNHVVFSYYGVLNGELIAGVLQIIDTKLKIKGIPLRRKKNVINILIEALQNMQYHSTSLMDQQGTPHKCFIAVAIDDNMVELSAGNAIVSSKSADLARRIDDLNKLSKEELQIRYMQRLETGDLSDKGGAGLGLMRMLKESGAPIKYAFEPMSDDKLWFSINLEVVHVAEKVNTL